MNCRFCGTALPAGALYCGECGRAVDAPQAAPAVEPPQPVTAQLAFSSPGATEEPAARPFPTADSEYTCPQCGEPIDAADIFCGECGFVLPVSSPRAPAASTPAPAAAPEGPGGAPRSGPDSFFAPRPGADAVAPRGTDAFVRRPAADIPAARPVAPDRPDPFPWGAEPRPTVDLEATRLVAGASPEERFVLQFSTGESVTVTGAGLVGRNPASQPGEFVDQLVAIFDAGKSVSKTHLEFGQESGRFWVSDRYSTNGSIVRQPDAEPKRCEPGRRYFVARGTRVDIGEQFFVVS